MRIAVIGRGNVGGGLAKRWRAAGHEVTEFGRDGGDASDAEVILLAVPSGSVEEALGSVSGIDGKTVIDATNEFHGRSDEHDSFAHEVKAIVGGPVAKSFNTNFATRYGDIDAQPDRPGNFYVAEDDARAVTEQLIRDAGYDPISVGGLENARLLENQIEFTMAISQAGLGQHFYRYWS